MIKYNMPTGMIFTNILSLPATPISFSMWTKMQNNFPLKNLDYSMIALRLVLY